MNIQVDISKRVGWISDRVDLCDMAKDYIKFQMKEAVVQALSQIQNIESEIVVSDSHDTKHGVYTGVRNTECEADQSDVLENTSDAALETRIDSEKICYDTVRTKETFVTNNIDRICNCVSGECIANMKESL